MRDIHDLDNMAVDVGDFHFTARDFRSLVESQQHSEPPTGDIRELCAVDNNLRNSALDKFEYLVDEFLTAVLVDTPVSGDNQYIVINFMVVKFHTNILSDPTRNVDNLVILQWHKCPVIV
jgi:hypothetical protein